MVIAHSMLSELEHSVLRRDIQLSIQTLGNVKMVLRLSVSQWYLIGTRSRRKVVDKLQFWIQLGIFSDIRYYLSQPNHLFSLKPRPYSKYLHAYSSIKSTSIKNYLIYAHKFTQIFRLYVFLLFLWWLFSPSTLNLIKLIEKTQVAKAI